MARQAHLIDKSAHVFCPLRGKDVDIEQCLACSHLENFDLNSRRPYLACRVPDFGEREPRFVRTDAG